MSHEQMFFYKTKLVFVEECKVMQDTSPVNVIIAHQMQERYLGPVTGHASKV